LCLTSHKLGFCKAAKSCNVSLLIAETEERAKCGTILSPAISVRY
jgi:hypothetical protein